MFSDAARTASVVDSLRVKKITRPVLAELICTYLETLFYLDGCKSSTVEIRCFDLNVRSCLNDIIDKYSASRAICTKLFRLKPCYDIDV